MKTLSVLLPLLAPCLFLMQSCDKDKLDEYPYPNQLDWLQHNYTRSYILHVPPSYSGEEPVPLVLVIHGYTGTASDMEEWTHMSEKADEKGFIVAYPNGIAYPWNENNPQAWNCGGPWEEWTAHTDDVGFINKLIETISGVYVINENRIYITGHSNGSMMTYRLGLELADKIAAIAPVSGQFAYIPYSSPDSKVSALHLHAINDGAVNYFGEPATADVPYPSVDSVLNVWSGFYGCKSAPDTTFINEDYMIKEWSCSGNNPAIQLYLMQRGEHQWFTVDNSGIDATGLIWNFFENHPKR